DGRITDGQGRTVDFRNTAIIMTSNIGSEHIMREDDAKKREKLVLEALRGFFRPEFLNRLDETVIFDRLTEGDLRQIVRIQLERVRRRLEAQGIKIELGESELDFLAREGYDPVYGARPLKRTIQRLVLDPLSLDVLEGKFKEGDTVRGELKGGRLAFRK
ncbi:MAG: AAA family ATPase, partial [Verrucomicrobiales bacterium]